MRKVLLYLTALLLITGCVPTKKLKYTINTPGSQNVYNSIHSLKRIQPHDYLFIKVYSLDPTTHGIFNDKTESGMMNVKLVSYEVDKNGFITFPFVGKILVADLTIDEAQIKLEKELGRYLTNISLRVRFVGNKITLLGEVNEPGTHSYYDEKINIFEAIAFSNGITEYGNKTTVTLIREMNNEITYSYLDLTNKNIAESEYYYLQPNDIILVNPLQRKYNNLQDRNLIHTISAALSLISTTAVFMLAIL